MKTRKDHLNTIKGLFSVQKLAVLSTQNQGQPYASLVAFSFSQDLEQLYFLTPTTTRKYGNLTACDRVALLINSACNQADDFTKAVSVTATGRAGALTDKAGPLTDYLTRHPQLADFSKEPSTAVVCVDVDAYIMVRRFQEVVTLRMVP